MTHAPATKWRVVGDSAGFYGVSGIAQEAADFHCLRYGHSPTTMDALGVGSLARCVGCGRSIALLTEAPNGT